MKGKNYSSSPQKAIFRWQKTFQYFLIAWQLLTTIPLKRKKDFLPKDFDVANSTLFFPLVGGIIGIILFFIYFLVNNYHSLEVTSILILGGWVCITGALHIDGLADTIDGLSGGQNKKEILTIMKDAHIGAKGVIGVILVMMIKFFLIIQVTSSLRPQTLIYAPILGRWAMVIGCYVIPYVKDEGMGKFTQFVGYPHIIGATLITIVLGIFLLGVFFLIPLIAVGILSLIWSFYLKRKIGGFSGDTLGALNELGEVVALFFI